MSLRQNWCQLVNVDKVVLPNIFQLLRKGAHGVGSDIYPKLLPLLSQLPPEVKEERPEVYQKLLEALREGMTTTSGGGGSPGGDKAK